MSKNHLRKPLGYLVLMVILGFICTACPSPVPTIEESPVSSSIPSSLPTLTPQPSFEPTPKPIVSSQVKPSPSPKPQAHFKVEIIAGSGQMGYQDGKASEAKFAEFSRLCANPTNQSVFILEKTRIRQWLPQGQVITVAGSDESGFRDGAAEEALFQNLIACDVANDGTLYLADDTRVRLLKPTGEVLTLAGGEERQAFDGRLAEARFAHISELKLNNTGEIYLVDGLHLRYITEERVETLNKEQQEGNSLIDKTPGIGKFPSTGPIDKVHFGYISSLTVGADNEVYISDSTLRTIYLLDKEHNVSEFAISEAQISPGGDHDWSLPMFITYFHSSLVLYADGYYFYIFGEHESSPMFPDEPTPYLSIGETYSIDATQNAIYFTDKNTYQVKRIVMR